MSISDETIRKTAQVIGSVMSRWDMDGRPDVPGGVDVMIARALAEEGLIAPAPLREEVGYMEPCGEVWSTELPGEDTRVRRYVTEWEEA